MNRYRYSGFEGCACFHARHTVRRFTLAKKRGRSYHLLPLTFKLLKPCLCSYATRFFLCFSSTLGDRFVPCIPPSLPVFSGLAVIGLGRLMSPVHRSAAYAADRFPRSLRFAVQSQPLFAMPGQCPLHDLKLFLGLRLVAQRSGLHPRLPGRSREPQRCADQR